RIPGMAHEQAPALALLNLLLPGPAPEDAARSPATLQALPGTGLSRDPGLLGRTLLLPATPSGNAAAREALQGIEQRWLDRLQRQWRPTPELQERFGLLRTDFERQWRLALHDPEHAPAMVSEAVGAGDWRLVFRVLEGLPQVRLDDVLAVAGAYLRSENRSVVRGVTDATITAPQTIEQPLGFLEGLFSRPVQVQRVDDPARVADGDAALGRGEGDAATAGASPVELFETDAAALDAATQRYTLPSGLRMAALSRPNRDERVSLLLQLRWGSPREMARWQAWRPLPALLEEGTTEHSAQQLRQIRQQLQMQVGFVAGPQGLSVQLQARRGTLVQALVLLREMLEKPLLPEAAFRREQAAALSRLGGGGAEERERQYRMLQQGLNRGEPGYVPSAAELAAAWREMRVEDVRAYHQRFWSANEARVAVVGALPDKLPGVLEDLIGRWKKPEAPAYQPFVQHHLPERAQRFVSRAAGDGPTQAAAMVVMHQEFPLQRDEPDSWPMQAAARILAGNGEPGGTRLADRLRAAESLSYAVNSSLRIASEGNRSYLRLQASSAPRNATRVEAAMREEIDRALADGVTADEVEAARRWLRANQRQALLNDVGLMALLMEQMDRGASFATEGAQASAALAALSVDSVNAAMRRLLRPEGWVTVVRGMAGP
ncbi:pitrilysin family protein, partial [Pelomonas sp. KK5]|uniref:M16 family metallopeptidase n=1 Tax=Pelomonas sp. KK5 TaxID=1855730 RepID=UPI00117DA976